MKKLALTEDRSRHLMRLCGLILAFLALTVVFFFALREFNMPGGTLLQQGVYTLGGALLLAGIGTGVFAGLKGDDERPWGPWTAPLLAAGLSFYLFTMTYAYLGVWPLGEKAVMLVDMHHQYAPLLSELRDMLLHGGSFSYSFHIGLGANFIPAFAYYLSSPFNLLLVLFPEAHLTEGILVITLLKNALAAGAFAACAQYLYRRRDWRVVALSVLYSMMLYMLAYSWNIMWLDVVPLLPLVVLAMEHMLRTGKYLPYSLLLALALFSNYYIGFMLCVFLVLYMLVWMFRRRRNTLRLTGGISRFALASLLGGGLAAFLLVPTALALSRTSAAGDTFPQFDSNFALFELIGRFFYGATPTIRSGNLPNLYCGLPAVLLAPLYFAQRRIPLRRRLCYGGLLAVMLVSCTLNQWDLVWHGLHTPNDLPYRFSFLVCFVLLLLAGYALTHLEQVTAKQVLCSLALSAGYLILWEQFGRDNAPKAELLYGNLLLLAIYGVVLLCGAKKALPRRAMSLLLLGVVCAELLLGSSATITTMNNNEYYTNHADYLDNADTAADAAAVKRAQEWAAADADTFGAFSRLEYLPRSTCMDTARHHYKGITTFASSNPYQTTLFMGQLGYAINGVNSYLYHSFVAASDSLLGIHYVVLEVKLTAHPQLKLVDSVTVDGVTRYIYRNELALPVGYYAHEDILNYSGLENAPFLSQEELYGGLTGERKDIYTALPLSSDDDGATVTGSSFYKPESLSHAVFTAHVQEKGQYFAFVDCRAADSIQVTVYNENDVSGNSWSVTTYEPYIIDMGTLQPGEYAEVTIDGENGASGNIYIVKLETETMEQQLATLAAGGLKVTQATDTGLTGSVTAPEDGVLFFSIPYDSGWSITVDGEKVETLAIATDEESGDGAMLAARIPAGKHTVTLTYRAPGLRLGLLISLVCLLIVLLPLGRRWLLCRRQTSLPSPVSQALEAPAIPEEAPVPPADNPQ